MPIKHFLTCFLLSLLIAGCAGSNPTPPAPVLESPSSPAIIATSQVLTGLSRGKLPDYSASFEIHFTGSTTWLYRLASRKSPMLQEDSLHIEGIDQADNPGDVRAVTDGATTWMIGPATDNECVQFPNGQGMDPTYVYPETLLSFQDLYSNLSYAGEDTVAGIAAAHYTASSPAIGNWQDASVDAWQDESSGELLRFTMQASGNDAIFGTGSGKIDARYEVTDTKPAVIDPVKGCTLNVPLPKSAKLYVRLPGLASFESAESVNQIAGFYQSELPEQNWAQAAPPDLSNGSTVLSYQRDAEEVSIQIDPVKSGGCKVKLVFQQGN